MLELLIKWYQLLQCARAKNTTEPILTRFSDVPHQGEDGGRQVLREQGGDSALRWPDEFLIRKPLEIGDGWTLLKDRPFSAMMGGDKARRCWIFPLGADTAKVDSGFRDSHGNVRLFPTNFTLKPRLSAPKVPHYPIDGLRLVRFNSKDEPVYYNDVANLISSENCPPPLKGSIAG
eukprot:192236-Rhodomonas_salina.1